MRVAMIVFYFQAFCTVCDVHALSRVRSNVSKQHLYELPLAEITRPFLRRVRVYCVVFVHAQLEYQLHFTPASTVRKTVEADMLYFCKTFVP